MKAWNGSVAVVLCLCLTQVSSWPALYFRGSRLGYGRKINPLECYDKSETQRGVCMFAWDCMKANGTHLGTCIDRFYFGSCCKLQLVKPNPEENEIDSTSITDGNFGLVPVKPSTDSSSSIQQSVSTTDNSDNINAVTTEAKPQENISPESETTVEVSSLGTDRPVSVTPETVSEIGNQVSESTVVESGITTSESGESTSESGVSTSESGVSTSESGVSTSESGVSTSESGVSTSEAGVSTSESGVSTSESGVVTSESIVVTSESGVTTRAPGVATGEAGVVTSESGVAHAHVTSQSEKDATTMMSTETSESIVDSENESEVNQSSETSNLTTQSSGTDGEENEMTAETAEVDSSMNESETTEGSTTTNSPQNIISETSKPEEVEGETSPENLSVIISPEPSNPSSGEVEFDGENEVIVTESSATEASIAPETTEILISSSTDMPGGSFVDTIIHFDNSSSHANDENTTLSPETENLYSMETSTDESTVDVTTTIPQEITEVMEESTTTKMDSENQEQLPELPKPLEVVPGIVVLPGEEDSTETFTEPENTLELGTVRPIVEEPVTEQSPDEDQTKAPVISVTDAPTISETDAPTIPETDAPTISETEDPTISVTEDPTIPETDAPIISVTDAPKVDVKPTGVTLVFPDESKTTTKPEKEVTVTEVEQETTTETTFNIDEFGFAEHEQKVVEALKTSNYKDICGSPVYPTSRIVGGAEASYGQWPWQVSLRQWRSVAFLHKCGAALVNENWAITAAHCVEGIEPDQLLLVMGEFDLGTTDEPYPHVERSVQMIAMHPKFEPRTFEYDLALLRFSEPIEFQPNIIPICIPEDDYTFLNDTGFVTGWGRLYEDGPLPTVMQKVPVPVIPNDKCEEMYKLAGYIEHIPNIFICAGYQMGKQDSCEGDSGGPLVIKRNNRWRLAGVISWGIGCAVPNQPGVYTRISEFRDWINKIIIF